MTSSICLPGGVNQTDQNQYVHLIPNLVCQSHAASLLLLAKLNCIINYEALLTMKNKENTYKFNMQHGKVNISLI